MQGQQGQKGEVGRGQEGKGEGGSTSAVASGAAKAEGDSTWQQNRSNHHSTDKF